MNATSDFLSGDKKATNAEWSINKTKKQLVNITSQTCQFIKNTNIPFSNQ